MRYMNFFNLRSRALPLLAAVCTLSVAAAAHAQFRTSVQGTVTDSEGAVIPDATLTLKDNATNTTIVHKSDQSGVFNFNALPADHFTLTVTHDGFQTNVLKDVQFIPEQANSLSVKLSVGTVSETVNVDASTVDAVDTQTANIGGTISANDIQHMPSFNRDVFTLSQLIPGAISDGSQSSSGGVHTNPGNQGPGGSGNTGAAPTENGPQANANGQQYEHNSISIDGISTVSAVWGGTTIITPTEDSIDNVRIVTNDYDAENGRFSGAQTMVTSKSGTNQVHGSAFIALHRPGLNAYQPAVRDSSGAKIGSPLRDNSRYNQYGGSLGAPIIKDKLFAFFAYESSPLSTLATSNGWYETSAFRAAAPAGSISSKFLTFPGGAPAGSIVTTGETCKLVGLNEGVNCNTVAGQGLDIGSPLKSGLGTQDLTTDGKITDPGVGSGLDGVADVAYYTTATPLTTYYRQYNGRADYQATQKDRLSFTIYWVPQGNSSYNGGARSYNFFNHSQINEALSGIWNHTFSPTFLNEARGNAAGWRWNEISSNPQQSLGLPQDSIANFAPNASLNQFGTSLGSILNQWTFTYKDVATKILGRHTTKFGAEFTQLHYLANPIGRPNYTFYNIWDFLNDAPKEESGSFNSLTGTPGGSRADERENLFGAFIQDAWKVTPSLTLNAGLRYSYFGALSSKQNNLPSAQFGSGAAAYTGFSVQLGRSLWTPQKANFGPQVGFNWAPGSFNNKLVVRGGYGLSYNQSEIAITANTVYNPLTTRYVDFSYNSPTNPGPTGGNIIYGISSDLHSLNGFAANPAAQTAYNANGLPVSGSGNVIVLSNNGSKFPTIYVQHFSLNNDYQVSKEIVASVGYEGSLGRHLINHQTPNAAGIVAGQTLNPLITSGDYWQQEGSSNYNALLLEVKHPFVHHFSADAQFAYAKSLDTDGSGPYSEDPYYPLNAAYSYGPSDFNIGKSFKAFGLWQPVIFHGNSRWLEKIVGDWSLSGIFQFHTGFPYSPNYGIGNSLYCSQCGYYNTRPYYNGTGGTDHSNKAFINATNFAGITTSANPVSGNVNGGTTTVQYSNKYFSTPNLANAMQMKTASFTTGNVALPPVPGLGRNAFVGPRYRGFDASLAKGFGLPKLPILGENAKFEIRADAFNLFNVLSLDPGSVSSNVDASNFGQDTQALGGRTITIQGRFSF